MRKTQGAYISGAVALAAALMIGLRGHGVWLQSGAVMYLLLILPLAFLAVMKGLQHPAAEATRAEWALVVLSAALLLHLCTSATLDSSFFFLRWLPEPGAALMKPMVGRWMLATLVLGILYLYVPSADRCVLALMLVASVWACAAALYEETGFAALYGDDHPSFMLRLHMLSESFPRIFYYNPLWNGGKVATYAAASGTVGPGLFFLPVLQFVPVQNAYTPMIAALFILFVPAVAAASIRAAGGRMRACLCAAILALGVGLGFFRWLLQFGTVGSSFAGAAILPVACLLYRVVHLGKGGRLEAVALVAFSCLFLAWPGYWIVSAAIAVGLLVSIRAFDRRSTIFILGCGAVIAVVMFPLVYGLLSRVEIAQFAEKGSIIPEATESAWSAGLDQLQGDLREVNPIIVFLGLGGVFFVRPFTARRFAVVMLLVLVAMMGWGDALPGSLAVTRAAIPLAFLAIWPASLACEQLIDSKSGGRAVLAAAITALIGVSGYSASRFYGNQSLASYRVMNDETRALVDWIRSETPPDARVLFGGIALHGYGGGHVAMLPVLTGREMMAADYYHFAPKLVEYFYPPKAYRTSDDRVYEFTRLYNVSHVVAYDKASVVAFYRKYPDLYEEVTTIEGKLPKTIFRVKPGPPGFFMENEGRVEASANRFRIEVDDPSSDVVLRYHYDSELVARPPAALFPHPVGNETFLGIRPNGASRVDVAFNRWW